MFGRLSTYKFVSESLQDTADEAKQNYEQVPDEFVEYKYQDKLADIRKDLDYFKTRLDEADLYEFFALHNTITWYLKSYFKRYSLVVEFTPITINEDDKYRPKNLSVLKLYEYKCISRLNYLYSIGLYLFY